MNVDLNVIGVIATVLALIFAAGAIWNSIVRRRHADELARRNQPEEEEERIVFRPMPDAPASSQSPTRSTQPSPAAPSSQLFRKVRLGSEVEEPVLEPHREGVTYVWE